MKVKRKRNAKGQFIKGKRNPLTTAEQTQLRRRLKDVSGMAKDDVRAGHGGGEEYWRGQQAAFSSVLIDMAGKKKRRAGRKASR